MAVRLICLAVGYMFGLIQTAYIIGRMHGIDIRNYGSGNAGSTNAMRTMGRKAGLLTFVGDVLKCVCAVLLVRLVFGAGHREMLPLLSLYASAGVILGHNFPFYLKFRGGKGIACTVGLAAMLGWPFFVLGFASFALIFFTTHYVSLGSVVGYTLLFIEAVVLGQWGYFGVSRPVLWEMYIVLGLLSVMAIYRHRGNISRLFAGTESKMYLSRHE
ncbi:MAG TPA: acyl-phosphate glycerol 3-phosphate acyltransferase [Lachnospiraceae bacterium]|nr:acyl-phosphate glycerol 3-phosphate acyltransferase [Lachnospiraceae bacterium]